MLKQVSDVELNNSIKRCLPEFSGISHYWDKQRGQVMAKILPGEFYMTCDNISIATTLGSCVSACIWDVKARVGGMNHFMLPLTAQKAHEVNWGSRALASDATRYGNFAMEYLINMILKHGGIKKNLRAKVFGGGKVLHQVSDVGQRNIDFVMAYLDTENIIIEGSDLGSTYPRKVIFEPQSGRAFVKKLDRLHNDTIKQRESTYLHSIERTEIDGDIELF